MAQIVFTLEDGSLVEASLDADLITLGRRPDSTVVLPSSSVSGHHATIKRRGDAYYVQDMGSTNGTRLNGVDIEEAKLSHGDKVTFGDIPGQVYLEDEDAQAIQAVALPVPADPIMPAEIPASAYLPDRYSPKPSARKPKPSRPIQQYKQSSGFGGFLLFLLFLFFAFAVGLHVRHGQEHDGSVLIIDVLKKMRGDMEKKAEHKPASDIPAAETPAGADKKPDAADKPTM